MHSVHMHSVHACVCAHMCLCGCMGGMFPTLPVFSIHTQVHTVSQWVATQVPNLPHRGYEQAYKVWYGKDMMNELETQMGITEAAYNIYKVRDVMLLRGTISIAALLACVDPFDLQVVR